MQPTGGGDMNPPPPAALDAGTHLFAADQLVETASPISSRPPAANLDEFLSGGSGLPADEDALAAGDDVDRAGGSGGGGNRWPRQETLALLRIRSEMDATFRDATLKGPLWEDVSRKLGELGFKRSAKKCKEKFENVHKYYKRTKEGRAGRQDGKSYRFFSELEALHASTVSPSPAPPAFLSPPAPPISPTPISSIRFTSGMFAPTGISTPPPPMPVSNPDQGGAASFSTNTASTSSMSDDNVSSRKRKRGAEGKGKGAKKMMEFFQGLMKKVMQKQEALQQRFIEAVEKREQERMAREEAWKRQEMARLSREQEIMAQERAISASRDAAIISFLQKITGQTIQLPPHLNINPQNIPPPQPPPQLPIPTSTQPQPQSQPQPQPQSQPQPQKQQRPQPAPASTDVVMAVPPPQEMSGGGGGSGSGSFEGASPSRWPKTEVLALINLRSGMESKYQEAGPKGPLWEDISAGMKQLGYNRNSKRCKEKWENINKYFKKVKESNKKRPEDAKTCPYFHQLDALYRKKILTTANSQPQQEGFKLDPITITQAEQQASIAMAANLFGEPTANKPEDIVKQMMTEQQQQQQQRQQVAADKFEELGESDDGIEDEEDDEEEEEKMDYKIEFQRQNTPSNGGGNGASSFLTMVQELISPIQIKPSSS